MTANEKVTIKEIREDLLYQYLKVDLYLIGETEEEINSILDLRKHLNNMIEKIDELILREV